MNRQFLAFNGLAITLVLLNHSIMMVNDIPQELGYSAIVGWQKTILSVVSSLGIIAVPIFMFISGSFFAYAAQTKNKGLTFIYRVSWANIKHILWPYLIWSFMFYVAVFIGRGEEYTIRGYIKNLIVGYPYNFIPLLLFYYALAPIIVQIGRRYGLILLLVIAVYQSVLINLVHPGVLGVTFPEWMNITVLPILSTTMALWGVFFPLGLIYGLHMRSILPELQRVKWILLIMAIMCYVIALLDAITIIEAPWAVFLCPVLFVLLLPVIKRRSNPIVRELEKVGQRVYGIYLTHLLVLYFALLLMDLIAPGLLIYRFWFMPILFVLALGIPLTLMRFVQISQRRNIYPYMFG